MKTKNIVIGVLTTLLVAHFILDFYFINQFVYPLENRALQDYSNYNSKIVSSWLGGERLVNTETNMRSATFQKFYSNDFMRFNDSLVRFSENGKIGFLNSNTMEIVIPARFKIATEFSDGLALAVSDSFSEKYGFINRQGYWKIRPKYDLSLISGDDDTTHFTPRFLNGFCKIRTAKGYVYIDKSGMIKSKSYRQILALMPGNYRIIEKNSGDKWGIIDSTFQELISPNLKSREEAMEFFKRNILPKLDLHTKY